MSSYWSENLRDVWEGIRSQPGRRGVAFLALVIGTACLTLLLAALGGLKVKAHGMLSQLGVGVVGIVGDVRQLRSKLVDSAVRDLRAAKLEVFQIREATQVLQTGVGDLRVVEKQPFSDW